MRLAQLLPACAIALAPVAVATAQTSPEFEVGIRGGILGYQGDLQSAVLSDYGTRPVFGAFVRYPLAEKLAVRGSFEAGTLAASDADAGPGEGRFGRGLSFEAPLFNVEVVGEWLPFRRISGKGLSSGYNRLNPYGFVGVGYTHAGAEVTSANVADDARFPEPGDVSDFFAVPVGGGLRYDFPSGLAVGAEGTLRTVFSDRLDGITGATVQSTTDDYYWSTVLWVSYRLGGGRGKKGCPTW